MHGATGQSIAELEAHFEGKMYGHLKTEAAEAVVALLEPIQQRYQEFRSDESALLAILQQGAEKAQVRADETMRRVFDAIGFVSKR